MASQHPLALKSVFAVGVGHSGTGVFVLGLCGRASPPQEPTLTPWAVLLWPLRRGHYQPGLSWTLPAASLSVLALGSFLWPSVLKAEFQSHLELGQGKTLSPLPSCVCVHTQEPTHM